MPEKQIQITRFDGGMSDEDRDLANGYFHYLENVNCGDKMGGIKQVSNVTAGTDNGRGIRAVLSVGSDIYGLGVDGSLKTDVWKSANGGATWSSFVTPAGASLLPQSPNLFFIYANGYIYYNDLNIIVRTAIGGGTTTPFSTIGEPTFNATIWNGDFYSNTVGNHIYKTTTAGASTDMIIIPTDQTIVKLLPYGDLLAIICTSSTGDSQMYLWDGGTTTTFYDIIKIGRGDVKGGEFIGGTIKVVLASFNGKDFRIKRFNGTTFETEQFYSAKKNTAGNSKINIISQVKKSKDFIYFLGEGTHPNTTNAYDVVLFRYGNKLQGQPDSLSIYKYLECAVSALQAQALTDFTIIDSAGLTGDYVNVFAIVDQDGSYATNKEVYTDGTLDTQAGVIETGIITGGNSSIEKDLKEMSIMCNPLTSGQSIKLSYKPNADTTWTEIITINTVGMISYEPVLQADGSNLRTSKEVSLKFELLGGAELTMFTARYEEELGTR